MRFLFLLEATVFDPSVILAAHYGFEQLIDAGDEFALSEGRGL